MEWNNWLQTSYTIPSFFKPGGCGDMLPKPTEQDSYRLQIGGPTIGQDLIFTSAALTIISSRRWFQPQNL